MGHNLAVRAILDGSVPAEIHVDHPIQPRVAITWNKQRHYLAGSPENKEFNDHLRRRLAGASSPRPLESGDDLFVLYYAPADAWEDTLDTLLRDRNPIHAQRQYYTFQSPRQGGRDWSPKLPEGFTLRYVDRDLLAQEHLRNLDDLIEELCSERQSVQDFLARSFGFCLLHGDEVAGWCLSEYNTAGRCEVGIATFEPYRRRGLATIMASALVEHALSQGISHVGWHCHASNIASAATALKVGFKKLVDYPVRFAYLDQTINLAVHGNVAFRQEQYDQALARYQAAFLRGDAPTWAFWNAACASALLDQRTAALRYLDQALDRGFDDLERMLESEHLTTLHGTEEWQALTQRLETTAPGSA
jgi:RimJ/RimL family protein N-acetyltransferase